MDNPAFEDDGLGDELGDDSSSDESTTRETDESTDTSDDATGSSSSDDATTQTSSTLDTTSTSEDTTDATSDDTTDETTEGMTCAEGLTDCGGWCVDIETDPFNCGDCGLACADGQVCAGDCLLKKYVFVSSQPLSGSMGGILGADEFCAGLAFEAGLPGTYLAWNSTDLSFPDLDFVKGGAYVRTDGHIVATSYEDLTDGSLAKPINLDENGFEPPAYQAANCPNVISPVWSNTTPDGQYAGGSACYGWISASNQVSGKIGSSMVTDNSWSEALDCNVACGTLLPIYCVQQDL